MKTVHLDVPHWFYNPRGSDWRMKMILSKELDKFNLRVQRNWLYVAIYNLQLLLAARLPLRLRWGFSVIMSRLRGWVLGMLGVDYLIAQGSNPPTDQRFKLLWETYFLPPQRGEGGRGNDFVRGGRDKWIRSMETYGSSASFIAVRGAESVRLLKAMYPEFAHKVLDLRFVQPEFNIASTSEVEAKQKSDVVKILFVGREARRKGLPRVIEALKGLRESGIENFELTVVSSFVDGYVEGLNESWINCFRELSHEEVLEMFRRSHIFVMPSEYESYGLVYLEAMANGCAVVARDQEPQCELMDYGNAGLLVNSYSTSSIASALKSLIADQSLRLKIALNGVEYYKNRLSQERVRESWSGAIQLLAGI